jgi:hypothetical protein
MTTENTKTPVKLEEGKWYPFIYHADIVLPDGEKFLLAIDPGGVRHLLSYLYYKDYGFEKGKEILVRIDKINCSGKIFLEPAHPHYREGEEYDFDFLRAEYDENIFGELEYYWVVADKQGNEIQMAMEKGITLPENDKVTCKVNRIKKAKLYLTHAQSKTLYGTLTEGQWYSFIVENDKLDLDGVPYYVLLDEKGHRHLLKRLPYDNFNIRKDQPVVCKVIKWSNKGMYILEPEHPLYKDGLEFPFVVSRVFEDYFEVKDLFWNDIEVLNLAKLNIQVSDSVSLVVRQIRKGLPVVELP